MDIIRDYQNFNVENDEGASQNIFVESLYLTYRFYQNSRKLQRSYIAHLSNNTYFSKELEDDGTVKRKDISFYTYFELDNSFYVKENKFFLHFNYCANRWISLQNYLTNGTLEIDSNFVENSIRPLALGRKNYLFAGSPDAAKDIAMFYSFFASCTKMMLPRKNG